MNYQEIRHKIRQLSGYQNGLAREDYPTTSSELLDELFLTRSEILKSFGLPETPEYLELLDFDNLLNDEEINAVIEALKSAATAYLLTTPIPDVQLLSEARKQGLEAQEILPLLQISTHLYTIYVYENMLLTGRDTPANVYKALRNADKPQILTDLGTIVLRRTFGNEEKRILKRLNDAGVSYLNEYLEAFIMNNKKEPWGSAMLDEFMEMLKEVPQPGNLQQHMDTLAGYLLNHVCLAVSGQLYRITECEMYYHDPDHHPDPYTHKRSEQLQNGFWYFNDFGLDITFGNEAKGIYAGMLIRGIQSLTDTNRFISGPSNVIREIFSRFGSILSGESHLYLRNIDRALVKEQEPVKAKRIGLTKKENDTDNYKEKLYRYLVELNVLHKFAEKEKVLRNLVAEGKITPDEAKVFIGYKINFSK